MRNKAVKAMVDAEIRDLSVQELPDEIEYFVIDADGSLTTSSIPEADVYIDEFQIQRLTDVSAMKHVRENYGSRIGVMRKVVFPVRPQKRRTTKMLLGVVKREE